MAKSKKRTVLAPNFHPGSVLEYRMQQQGKSLPQVARDSGIPMETLQALVNHEIGMTDELENGLPKAFDGTYSNWEWVQESYNDHVEIAQECIDARTEIPLLERFHAQEALRQGWTWFHGYPIDEFVLMMREHLRIEQLCHADPKIDDQFAVVGDRSDFYPEALTMWLHQGQSEFDDLSPADFDPDGFRDCLFGGSIYWRIWRLLRRSPFAALPQLSNICHRNGVGLVILENMPDIGATGAVRYDDDKPWIQITFNQQWMDQFWFDFFRLAAHIVLHPGQQVIYMTANSHSTRNASTRNGAAHVASANGINGTDETHHDQESPDEVIRIGEIDREQEAVRLAIATRGPDRDAHAQRLATEAEELASKRLTDQTTEGEADYGEELRWNTFASHQNFTARYIETQADKFGIHPGLLVNRLIREGLIPPDHPGINRLRTRVNLRERSKLRAFNV